MKRMIRLALCAFNFALASYCSMYSNQLETYKLNRASVLASSSLGKVRLSHDNDGFKVKHNGQITRVNNYDVDQGLRNINPARLAKLEKMGALIAVNQMSNGEFNLRLQGKLNGGGITGAKIGYWIGRTTVHVASQAVIGTIAVTAGIAAGAAGGPVAAMIAAEASWAGMTAATMPAVELTSNLVGIAGGIIGGVSTGAV